jgi:hypothetical protein
MMESMSPKWYSGSKVVVTRNSNDDDDVQVMISVSNSSLGGFDVEIPPSQCNNVH